MIKPFIGPNTFSPQEIVKLMRKDKKALDQVPRFVILNGLGSVESYNEEYCSEVDPEIILSALEFLQDL